MKAKRVSKNQWLEIALDAFALKGVEGIKITTLAKELGIARSGFYWHFKNRQDLLLQLLEYWASEYTGVVTDNPDFKNLNAEKRLLATMKMVREKELAKFDLAMNAWAKLDPLVNSYVKKVVKMRLDFTRATFAELGFKGDELEMRTRLFVCYHSWEGTMFADLSNQNLLQLQKLRYKFLIQK